MRKTFFTSVWMGAGLLLIFSCAESPPAHLPLGAPILLAPAPPPLDPALQSFLDGYEQYFSSSMHEAGTPGAAVVIVKDSQVVFMRGYGVKIAGGDDPVTAHTVFRIGSLSKGFAGVLSGILVKKGLLDWHDPVQKYCPGFALKDKEQARRVEVRHLLSHTTGLPYHAFDNLVEQGFDRQTILDQYFTSAKLFDKEGQFYRYQNVAFSVIEPVLEAAAGKTYPELLMEHIFRPAGMGAASCDFASMQQRQNKAMPHRPIETGWEMDTISPLYYGVAAAGGVNASIADMGEWLKVLLGHKPEIVAGPVLDEVFRPVIKTGAERRILPGWIGRDSASYAMGWRILEKGGDTLVYHGGFVNHFHSEIAFDRREGIGICVLFNSTTPLKGACIREFFERWYAQRQGLTKRCAIDFK